MKWQNSLESIKTITKMADVSHVVGVINLNVWNVDHADCISCSMLNLKKQLVILKQLNS